MNRPFLALATGLFALLLTACGGGGGDSSSSGSSGSTTGTIADTTSTTYTASLKAFAESFKGLGYVLPLNDLTAFAGQSGTCGGGGSLSFSDSTQTLTLCQRNYPKFGAYTGTYSGTGSASGIAISAINAVKVYNTSNTSQLAYTVTSGSFSATDTTTGNAEQVNLTAGGAVINVGNSSAYTLSQLNTQTTNNSTLKTVTVGQGSTAQIKKDSNTYTVSVTKALNVGSNAYNAPNTGAVSVSYSTTTACSPIVVTFVSDSQFSMACGGQSVTKNWSDADVTAALAAAVQ